MRAPLPATLLAGSQPHRAGFLEGPFSKVKGLLRKTEARTRETLIEAIGGALIEAITVGGCPRVLPALRLPPDGSTAMTIALGVDEGVTRIKIILTPL